MFGLGGFGRSRGRGKVGCVVVQFELFLCVGVVIHVETSIVRWSLERRFEWYRMCFGLGECGEEETCLEVWFSLFWVVCAFSVWCCAYGLFSVWGCSLVTMMFSR